MGGSCAPASGPTDSVGLVPSGELFPGGGPAGTYPRVCVLADGMILLSELSRRRIRSIQKLIRVGRNEVVVVLRVDKEKGEPHFLVVARLG